MFLVKKTHTWAQKVLAAVLLFIVFVAPAALGQSIAEGYLTNDDLLRNGMAVQLSLEDGATSTDTVERAEYDHPERIIGVTTPVDGSFALIGSSEDQVFVKTGGQVEAFVSDMGGEVQKGDVLTISRIKGVFMRASDKSTEIATAITGFEGAEAADHILEGPEGAEGQGNTKVYKILVSLDRHASQGSPNDSGTLSRISRALVGRDVGELRVIIALIVFALLLVVVGGIVYGSVSSSLTSMGRNPLAKGIIKKELIKVILMALGILLVGLGVVYTILWV